VRKKLALLLAELGEGYGRPRNFTSPCIIRRFAVSLILRLVWHRRLIVFGHALIIPYLPPALASTISS
jgi:hypothetical protein